MSVGTFNCKYKNEQIFFVIAKAKYANTDYKN